MPKASVTCLDQVFRLLRKHGPLDVAQICVISLLSMEEVKVALEELEGRNVVMRRPDEGSIIPVPDETLVVWGLPIVVEID